MRKLYIIYSLVCVLLILLTTKNYFKDKTFERENAQQIPQKRYILISEGENVRLYFGEQLIREYPDIAPSSLPLMDQDNLKSGMIFENYTDVSKIIEDFDG